MDEQAAVDTGFQGLQQAQTLATDHFLGVAPLPVEHVVGRDTDEHQQDQYDAEDEIRRQVESFVTDNLHGLTVETAFDCCFESPCWT